MRTGRPRKGQFIICKNCGETFYARHSYVLKGRCFCSIACRNALKHLHPHHNIYKTPEGRCWSQMHRRCYKLTDVSFANYGGRGIQVCIRWHRANPKGLDNFLFDMGKRPEGDFSIDRINNDLSYMPSNCRWATRSEQGFNRRIELVFVEKRRTEAPLI